MKEKYAQITNFDIIEKEMDEVEWEDEIRFLEGFRTLLKDLEDGQF